MATLANGRVEGGSFWIAPNADITDGKLELVTIRPIKKWLIPFLLVFFLFKKPHWIPHVQTQKVSEVLLSFDQIPEMHADGEVISNKQDKLVISLIPNGLEILT
ncbi:MAG: hypothetical protein U5J63_01160 [Fodinibius sp.]|nr:hypothetical protein [Fodinibius sp.]